MSYLQRFAGGQAVDPKVARGRRTVVIVEQARAIGAERLRFSGEVVNTLCDGQFFRCAGGEIVNVDPDVPIDVRRPGDGFAVTRKISATDPPLVFGEP